MTQRRSVPIGGALPMIVEALCMAIFVVCVLAAVLSAVN